jgi:hypothetical protein
MLNRRTKRMPGVAARNVVVLRQRILANHHEVLARWLEAGRCMGLCDASVFLASAGRCDPDYVLVWVRENPDPAYMITSEGMRWRVTDCIRGEALDSHTSFEAALHYIRPVLNLHAAA